MDVSTPTDCSANVQSTVGLCSADGGSDEDHPGEGDPVDNLEETTFQPDSKIPHSTPLNGLWRSLRRLGNQIRVLMGNKQSSTKSAYISISTIDNGSAPVPDITWYSAVIDVLYGILTSSRVNLLLAFVPVGLACYFIETGPLLTFILNGIAIVPLSALLTNATERIAAHSGDTLGALLNITLGNLVELILLVALANNHIRVVQASLLGSVLVNLLPILGSALLAASARESLNLYNTAEAQLLACLLFVSVFTFIMPSAFDKTFDNSKETADIVLKMTRISSILVLCIYMVYFIHEIRTNKSPSKNEHYRVTLDVDRSQCNDFPSGLGHNRSTSSFALPPRTIRFADESSAPSANDAHLTDTNRFELGSLATDGDSDDEAGGDESIGHHARGRRRSYETDTTHSIPNSRAPLIRSSDHGRSISVTSSRPRLSRDSSVSGDRRTFARSGLTSLQLLRDNRYLHDHDLGDSPGRLGSTIEIIISVVMLALSSILMSMNADLLVASIDEVTEQSGLSHTFIGLIILPIVGNVSEYVTVVTVAVGDKLDLAIAVAVGSSIQIALCVAPLIVIAGWLLQVDFPLTFNVFEMTVLVGTVLLVNLLILNSTSSTLKTSGLKGALMCVCYGIIGLGAFFAPEI